MIETAPTVTTMTDQILTAVLWLIIRLGRLVFGSIATVREHIHVRMSARVAVLSRVLRTRKTLKARLLCEPTDWRGP